MTVKKLDDHWMETCLSSGLLTEEQGKAFVDLCLKNAGFVSSAEETEETEETEEADESVANQCESCGKVIPDHYSVRLCLVCAIYGGRE